MGWMWISNNDLIRNKDINEENISKSSSITKPSSSPLQSSSIPHENNEVAEKEFQALFFNTPKDGSKDKDETNHQINTSATAPSLAKKASATNSTSSPTTDQRKPISEQLLPTDMSCRDAFDSAFYCNSLGGSFNHLYRYGTARSCSEHWSKFWLCMRIRTYDDESKKKSIQDYYRKMENKKYGERGTSSEDIWTSRDQLVEKGTAFRPIEDEEWNKTDEEWQNAALEMRLRIMESSTK
ncbi:hypothetical protein OnM2_066031 [Erysiphe neolycopersici]|uniref:Early meiotic induction protein 1 n=1 Tax=Erysiphe neolycopersici TaxID=212602 RepID=A0A420HMN4_9PEZI|nr:hypothetical protein OnM2_066031 [Erysiphe neolycopersici]